jgi:hypothetical protein
MPAERREQVIAVRLGSTGSCREELDCSAEGGSLMQWHEPDDARVSRPDL